MARKRPLLDKQVAEPKDEKTATIHSLDEGQGTPEPKKENRTSKTVKSSVYYPPNTHRKLAEIAFAERVKIHDLLMEGVDEILKSRGWPKSSELDPK